ncbi:MAG: C25 family cysteine peptidase [Bacteroidota bacterium]|nr:C25 family cysteine peptidase [Bacteroidota bacterium]
MKIRYVLLTCCLLLSGWAFSQPYGNEWINFSTNQPHSVQQYFKISVWRDGIYRITLADLQAAQFPAPFNPKQLQVFHNGVEQFIHVEGEADGVFDPADYVEFYGIRNDGAADTRLYKNPDHQPNPNLSLFTDTASYFLTLNANPLINNRRIVIETDVNYIGYSPIPYFMRESMVEYKSHYNASKIIDVVDSEFDEGEGWYYLAMENAPSPFTYNPLPVPNVSLDPAAPLARAVSYTMGGNYNGGIPHSLQLSVNGASQTSNFTGFEVSRFDFPLLSNSSLTGGTVVFAFTPGTTPVSVVNRNHVSFIKMIYPHSSSFAGELFNFRDFVIPGGLSGNKSYLNLSNLNLNSPKLYMIAGDTLKKITMTGSGTNWQALLPTYGIDRTWFLTDTIYTTTNGNMRIAPVSSDPSRYARFINFLYIAQADYLIVTHQSLMNKANDYKNYRTSTGFTPLLVDVDELYNQFTFGIEKHPLSIRNFCELTKDNFTLKPEYLLLIGKSVSSDQVRINPNYWSINLVPTFGFPPSDMLLGSRLTDTIPRAEIAVGRISASNENDIQAYLDKVVVHEQQLQQCPKDWMKQVLHFGGGNNATQQAEISQILHSFENIIEDTLMGANVTTILKTSPDPIQVNLSQYLQALIDTGVTLMTFVAHASGTTFDISTDIPQNYNNKDRYPLILANSCFVGDIHDPLRRVAEDFVLLPDKGSLGFIAQPSVGYLGNLKDYSGSLYQHIAKYNYGGSIGKSMARTIDSIYASPAANSSAFGYYMYKSVNTGMTLSGDPALVLNSFDKADLEVVKGSVYFTPAIVTSDIDSFDVNVIVKNLGKAYYNPFTVNVVRKFPDGTTANYDTIINYITYKDTLTFRMPVVSSYGVGVNYFDVYADFGSNVIECDETNNNPDLIPLLIQSSDILPVYPAEFAIVPNDAIQLKASTVSPFLPIKPYSFQIDTIDSFNSPFMKQGNISSVGGVVKWTLPFNLQPDLVYYWRVSRDSMPGDSIHPNWNESSFIHKPGLTGWSQAHYSQFKKDNFVNVDYSNSIDTTFAFVSNTTSLYVRNFMFPDPSVNVPGYDLNQATGEDNMCYFDASIHVFVIDPLTLEPWNTGTYNLGQINTWNGSVGTCRQRSENYFIFRDTPVQRVALENMLTNSIPNGHYVGIYSVNGVQYSNWDPSLKQVFIDWGSDSINFIQNISPYIFFTKKGDPSFTQEELGDSTEQFISLSASLGGNWDKGFVKSVTIGPAASWTSLHWDQFPIESSSQQDSISIDILGIQSDGVEVPLVGFQAIPIATPDLNINSIDALLYPRLKLRAYMQDELLFTPPQLKRWQIYYDEVPELALNPARYFTLNKDTLAEGEQLTMSIAIENIGNVNADSVLVDFFVYDKNRVRHDVTSPRYKEMAPGDTIIGSVSFNTSGYDGLNALWIEVNPENDQPEQYHFNNLAEIQFRVNRDITNPILDVTFDGIHILNGDIISGKPHILVKLKDENKHLALNDTSDWQIFLKDPNGSLTKLFFEPAACAGVGNEVLKWCPANLPQNTFLIEYKPVLAMDGIYELWVQASDASGNISGNNNYRISFEVINRATITEVINYPNPFSTSTKFVFTLTGSEVPEDFKIQIMTVTGKVIREINRHELGPIHIGRNITEFAWNGKDEFGDQLANGVYLYRVLTKLNGSNIEKRETEADKYFTKGWGKMYLMR